MKKFTLMVLMAVLALPMLAQSAKKNQPVIDRNDRSIEQVLGRSLQAFDWTLKTVATKADVNVVYECGFETDEELAQWSVLDADNDGYNWEVESYYAHGGTQSLTSRSYYGGPLNPDNWLFSPSIPLGGTVKFWAMNYMSSYPDKIAVYVCEGEPSSIDDFVKMGEDITPPTSWTEYSFDLSAYAGEGCIAIRHYNSEDEFRIFVDDFVVEAPATAMPENVVVADETATSAVVTWNNDGNVAWNLRYREIVGESQLWDFEDEAQIADWTFVDSDGDGFNWQYFNYSDGVTPHMTPYEGYGNMSSASYDKETSAPLFPDNWMISPKVKLEGTLSFYAAGQDPSYAAEVFAVYVSEGDPTIENFVKISDDITAAGEYEKYEFDLSEYAGKEGYFAIRHYNVTDMFWLNVDNVEIGLPQPEWEYIYNADDIVWVLEGLNPETSYEVQVQGIDADGHVSGWTESVNFTTLAETGEMEELYMVGTFNDWNQTEEGGRIVFEQGDDMFIAENVELEADAEFKLITPDENDPTGWKWFGGVDENQVGYFLINNDLLGININLVDGANFRMAEAGTYNFMVYLVYLREGPSAILMNVVKSNPTAVTDLTVESTDNTWYNIQGMKIQGVPTVPGIYINSGKKVVIK